MNPLYYPDNQGFYGDFGGAFIPEMLYPNIHELQENYLSILESKEFVEQYSKLLTDYVGRPTPLYLAKNLSERYHTNVWLKREDLAHTGSHKINNTVGQVLLAKKLGKNRIIAETGAGQHGVATATVCALMNMECIVFMGETDMKRQAPNVARMKMLGAEVQPATSGSKTLKDATNEAIRYWINHPNDTHYIIGSVVGPHPYPDLVARLQSIISKEITVQLLGLTGRSSPDAVIACVGGGSNAAGAFFHFLKTPDVLLIGAEAAGEGVNTGRTAASLHQGSRGIIHGSMTMLMQDKNGQITEPHSISAGLDYPGIGPLHAQLFVTGKAKYYPITDNEALKAAFLLSRLEGIIPALESAHALAVLDHIHFDPGQHVVINLSGRGDKDLSTFLQNLDNYASVR
ncbi:MAG: tryptophan synthase subunit beta [Bacteroidia bacterium]|nr:tryptophan synthase subunit beta [Bacteroidia bacterium]